MVSIKVTQPTTRASAPVTREQALTKARALLVARGIGDPSGGLAEHLADEAMKVQARGVASAPGKVAGTRGMATGAGGPQRALTAAQKRIVKSTIDLVEGALVALDADLLSADVRVPYITGRWVIADITDDARFVLHRLLRASDVTLAERRDAHNTITLSRARLAELRVAAYSRLALVIRETFDGVARTNDFVDAVDTIDASVERFKLLDLDDTVGAKSVGANSNPSVERFLLLDLS